MTKFDADEQVRLGGGGVVDKLVADHGDDAAIVGGLHAAPTETQRFVR